MTLTYNLLAKTCPQGVHSKTFTPPPLNSFLSVAEVYDWHYKHSSQHPYYIYYDEVAEAKVTITWRDAVKAVYRIASTISTSLGSKKASSPKPVVGLLCSADTLTYVLGVAGIMRAGFPVFLISHRTSPDTLEHIIAKSGVSQILMNAGDKPLFDKLEKARQKLKADISVSYIPSSTQLFAGGDVEAPIIDKPALDDLCLLLHSSGSTALPELNPWTYQMTHTAFWQPWYGEQDMCGKLISTASMPMGGASGVAQLLIGASSGIVISGFKPDSSALVVPTPENVWESMIATESTHCIIVQPFLIQWVEEGDKIPALAALEGVMFGGGPLPKPVGDLLASKGVNIFVFFGSSEGGLLNNIFTKKMGMDWEWFSFYSLVYPVFRPQAEEGISELLLKNGSTHRPTRTNGVYDGQPVFATGDLLLAHPTIPNRWKFVCRAEDQETLGPGGPKINAVVMARILMLHPLISGAVLVSNPVGASHGFGVIIEPAPTFPAYKDLGSSSGALKAYKDLLNPVIDRYNSIVQDLARLTHEKIIIASPNKPFAYGEKGMPRRKDVIAAYQPEIRQQLV